MVGLVFYNHAHIVDKISMVVNSIQDNRQEMSIILHRNCISSRFGGNMRKDRITLNTCMNCKHCYEFVEVDSGYEYFCNLLNEDCSTYLYRTFADDSLTYKQIQEWRESHVVEPNETCIDWSDKEISA